MNQYKSFRRERRSRKARRFPKQHGKSSARLIQEIRIKRAKQIKEAQK